MTDYWSVRVGLITALLEYALLIFCKQSSYSVSSIMHDDYLNVQEYIIFMRTNILIS